jgi:hypothetical protein
MRDDLKLRRLVEFADARLDPKTLPRWRRDLRPLLTAGALEFAAGTLKPTDAEIQAMQQAAVALLDAVVSAHDQDEELPIELHPQPLTDGSTQVGVVALDGRVYLQTFGSALDVFRLAIVRLVERHGLARVRRCRADDCRRLLWKVKRREYCSDRCQSRDYQRDYRRR